MGPIGVMLYGFDKETAEKVCAHLKEASNREVELISASGREKDRLMDILNSEGPFDFEAREDPKVVMFLGFDGPMIHASMDGFPTFEGQSRPIFCTPTENNINWKLSELLEDLMEEREYFRKQKSK